MDSFPVADRRTDPPLNPRVIPAIMADLDQKVAENVPGRYFVDSTCIDCDLCRELAGDNFVRQDADGYSYVRTQPANPDEEAACRAAMDECPVEAIGLIGEV